MNFSGYVGQDTRNNLDNLGGGGGGGGCLTPCIQGFFFIFFQENLCLWDTLQKKTDFGGGRIWNKEQSEFFGMFRLTPWIRERFFHFRDPCFLVILWENEWMDLHEISIICQARHEKWLSRLCHTWLHCFTVSRLGATACLWAILRLNEIIDFHGIFMIGPSWHEEQSGTFWDDAFNHLNTGYMFLFSLTVFVTDIME